MLTGPFGANGAVEPGLLLQRKCRSNWNRLKGARHAVLKTLYSRTQRIGLDGASYLLDGLRKNLTFSSFVVAIVGVFFCPALEVVILAEQQLQGFRDYVRRRSVDELSVEL